VAWEEVIIPPETSVWGNSVVCLFHIKRNAAKLRLAVHVWVIFGSLTSRNKQTTQIFVTLLKSLQRSRPVEMRSLVLLAAFTVSAILLAKPVGCNEDEEEGTNRLVLKPACRPPCYLMPQGEEVVAPAWVRRSCCEETLEDLPTHRQPTCREAFSSKPSCREAFSSAELTKASEEDSAEEDVQTDPDHQV
jgi:hypothetical protein